MRFIDSHVHLSDYKDPRQLIALSRANGTLLLSAGIDKDTSGRTLDLAKGDPDVVRAFVGVHPSEVRDEPDLIWMEAALRSASGVGEIGLDPKYSAAGPNSSQMKAYVAQLAAAEKSGKPVQVHSRGAEKACLDTLAGFRLKSVLMHWFQGEALLGALHDRAYLMSFGPALIYSKRLQKMAASLDPKLVLSETDGPVAFEALGGGKGPPLIPSVVFALSRAWKVSFEDARKVVIQNGLRFLGARGKG